MVLYNFRQCINIEKKSFNNIHPEVFHHLLWLPFGKIFYYSGDVI